MNASTAHEPQNRKLLQGLALHRTTRRALAALSFATASAAATHAAAGPCSDSKYSGTDIDCAIILCLVGGFGPSECAPAYGCFMWRLTRVPPKPPVGFCPMGSMADLDLRDDDRDSYERTIREMHTFDYPEGARTISSVRAEVFDRPTTCHRGKEQDEAYDCTWTYRVNPDGSEFFRGFIDGHYRGKRVKFVDGEGQRRTVGDAEKKTVIRYNCYRQGRDDEEVCSTRTLWEPIATPVR